MEDLEGWNNPIVQYNDSLKKNGLAHVTPLVANVVQRSRDRTLTEIAMKESHSRPKDPTMESSLKRLKCGVSNYNEKVGANKKQKNSQGMANNSSLTGPKYVSTELKGIVSTQKQI